MKKNPSPSLSEFQHSNIPAFQCPLHSSIHFSGIGGCGMNGVAQLAAHAGYSVTGSDRAENLEIFQCLEKQGITLFPQNGSGITDATDFVVYSTAIENDNPDLVRARERGIPLLHRAEMLAKLCEGKEVIAVAGTAGKSTVTGLLGHIFQTLGLDPTVYCGAPILNWKRNVGCSYRLPVFGKRSVCVALWKRFLNTGKRWLHKLTQRIPDDVPGNIQFGSGPWIIEADESDKSFLHFHPDHAIITNIAEDHFELSELKQLFALFESQVSGTIIKPDPPRRSGTPPGRGFTSRSDSPPVEGWPKAGVGSSLIGKHNTENINNALALCKALGLDVPKCIEAVNTFTGIERRLERVGPKVIDDFAHSPVKIAAALEAVSGEFETFNVVWRPHGYTPLFQGLNGLIEAFSSKKAHRIFILPVYYAGGTVEKKITSEQFVKKLQAAGVPAEFQPLENKTGGGSACFQALEETLLKDALPVLVMGARDPELPKFARKISDQLDQISFPLASHI